MSDHEPRKKPWAGILVGVGLLLAMVGVGVVLWRESTRIMRPHTRKRSWEARTNLKSAFWAERSFFDERGRYGDVPDEVGFTPEYGNRYLYLLSTRGDVLTRGAPDGGFHTGLSADLSKFPSSDTRRLLAGIPGALLSDVGVRCADDGGCDVTILAAGDIDADPTIDVWSVSTRERVIGSQTIPPGVPFNHVIDEDP